MRYYPPSHFLSLFRKSKPSITVQTSQMEDFLDHCGSDQVSEYFKKVYISKRSIAPGDFAIWRRKVTLKFKKSFIQEWYNLGGHKELLFNNKKNSVDRRSLLSELSKQYEKKEVENKKRAKDGYYVFFVRKYPLNKDMNLFQNHMFQAIKSVAEDKPQALTSKKYDKQWVEHVNKRLNINSLNRLLVVSDCPYKMVKEE